MLGKVMVQIGEFSGAMDVREDVQQEQTACPLYGKGERPQDLDPMRDHGQGAAGVPVVDVV